MSDGKKLTLAFAPGCFDNFDGTQEELQELIAELHRLVDSGEIFDRAVPIDDEDIEAMFIEPVEKKPRQ
ncbi:MAG TPA: hypothetical protein DHW34_01790 [Actinobacteria bacterium]|nr:hypothetical protein [Actinomycetota bacterium]